MSQPKRPLSILLLQYISIGGHSVSFSLLSRLVALEHEKLTSLSLSLSLSLSNSFVDGLLKSLHQLFVKSLLCCVVLLLLLSEESFGEFHF